LPIYRNKFKALTPDLPGDWQVHHGYQVGRQGEGAEFEAILADRFLAEKGINVHDSKYLKGVPPKIHAEITAAQTRWWKGKVASLQYADMADAYRRVPLDEVIALSGKLDEAYASFWMTSGTNQSRLVTRIRNELNAAGGQCNFALGKAGRMQSLGFSLGASVGLFSFLTGNAKAAANIAFHNAGQKADFQEFVTKYEGALDKQMDGNPITKNEAEHLMEAFIRYLRALELDEGAVSKLEAAMGAYIDKEF